MKYNTLLPKSRKNSLLTFSCAIIFFLALAYGFVPEVLGGKIVNQSDFSGWRGMAQETIEHNAAHPDDPTYWTNSMFGGMPNVTMFDKFRGDLTKPLYDALLLGPRPASYLFVSLTGAFLLMLAFGMGWLPALGGAIAITFCSYNMQIIQVGHNTKMQAIAFMPWVLAALVFTYRTAMAASSCKKALAYGLFGSTLFAFALSFQIKANHPQITYYLAIIIAIYAIVLLVGTLIRNRAALGRFFAVSAMLLVIGCTGIATNLNKLIPTYEYTEYTMRGGTELAEGKDNADGLDLGYATAWSYGIEETPNLLIPNFNGGSSAGEIRFKNSETYSLLRQAGQPNLDSIMKSLPLYWGPQPFTAGPMYIGAISIFLFILGLCLYSGKEKWWLLVTTVIAVFLAWGNHFIWFTELWFDYAPLYNKFRTVSMALVMLQITIPVLGFLVLDGILKSSFDKTKTRRAVTISAAVTAGFCLLSALVPSVAGSFSATSDAGQPDILAGALMADRKTLLVKDAIRSLLLIVTATLILLAAIRKDLKKPVTPAVAGILFTALILIDLLPVGKRYLSGDDFVSKRDFSAQFSQRPADKAILADTDPDFRVLDISVNTFNDAHPSYHHKCIGGYSPAKMQRYQDLIEKYLTPEINGIIKAVNSSRTIQDVENSLPAIPTVSALNGKYIIIGADYPPVRNPYALGNCWFVDNAVRAETPDDEIMMIGETDLGSTAVIGDDFSWAREKIASMKGSPETEDSEKDTIRLTEYKANELRYRYSTSRERAAIFSEIYYPEGWRATIDGKPAEIFRADWILRGMILPEGEHEIVMRFDPQSYKTGEKLSKASSGALIVLLILSAGWIIAEGTGRKRASNRKSATE